MSTAPNETAALLQSVHRGERDALDRLLARDLDFIARVVRQRLGPELRAREETADLVQEAAVHVLRDGPRFVVHDQARFRALLVRLVENAIRDRARFHGRERRSTRREADGTHSVDLGGDDTPSRIVGAEEEAELLRLALELLDPDDRELVMLREYDGLDYAVIGERLGVTANTARMRFNRALPRLARLVEALRSGRIADCLERVADGAPPA